MAEKWLALDGLRGVAILLVVVAHAHLVPAWTGGMVGVTLFFVLSGCRGRARRGRGMGAVERAPRFLGSRVLRWFGLISYPLYLWHAPLLQIPELNASPVTRLATIAGGIWIAWMSWHLVERPISRSRWRMRFRPQVALPDVRIPSRALVVSEPEHV